MCLVYGTYNGAMTERELIDLWNKARLHIVISQLGPTFLLITTVGLMTFGLGGTPMAIRWAALGILLASGILGALVQYSSATDAMSAAKDLSALGATSHTASRIIAFAPWMNVVRFVTPTIFILIFVALAVALSGWN
jgi:hypothetical protein